MEGAVVPEVLFEFAIHRSKTALNDKNGTYISGVNLAESGWSGSGERGVVDPERLAERGYRIIRGVTSALP